VNDALAASIDTAVAARARLRGRAIRETAIALAEAARRWRDDEGLARALPSAATLSPAMIDAILPLVAEPLEATALSELHARESGAGTPPTLVAATVASNVPGLALPAIALGCLAGAAVVVKSGRADPLSAPAFRRALDAVDPTLAATIVTTSWTGGDLAAEAAVLARADVVVATGADTTVAAITSRHGAKVIAHGDRTSLAVVDDDADNDEIAALASDVARYEQRGCLSPHAVLVRGDARAVAPRLLAALDAVARDLAPPCLSTDERAARRLALEDARFAGAVVMESTGGAVVVAAGRRIAPGIGGRTVRLHAIADVREVVDAFPVATVECIGVGRGVALDVGALRARGVARICPVGRMQRPRIDWPRGQRAALASLFRVAGEPRIQVES
jgi:hypothetical protein